jgi:HEPN domain-containing protein
VGLSGTHLNLEAAQRFSQEADASLREAQDKSKVSDWAGAVKACQLCIELSVKGILKLFDVDFPPEHDASDRLASIPKKVEGMPDYILEALARSRMASKVWEPTHSLAVYGALDVGAGKLFRESDAKAAVECAGDAHNCLFWLIDLANRDQLKPRGSSHK